MMTIPNIPKTKIVYLFDEETGMYLGETVSHLLPPFDKPEYYGPPNSTSAKPRGEARPGKGYKINEKRNGWLSVEDWSTTMLWSKVTSMPAPAIAPGVKLPENLTPDQPPSCDVTEWPRWDEISKAWTIGPNNNGVNWYLPNETFGTCSSPWDDIPEGAQVGISKERKRAKMRVIKKRLLSDANDLIGYCQEMLEMPEATTGDQELLDKAKEYKREVMLIDTDLDPETFVEPEFPRVVFRQGDIIKE